MRKPKISGGGWGWIATLGVVVIADTILIANKKDTMSVVFGKALEHPGRRWPTILSWGLLTTHLFGVFMPPWFRRLDPIGFTVRLLGRELR